MPTKTLRELWIDQLQDLHDAETQLIEALPKMEKAATHDELKSAFREHLEETRQHVKRLKEILTKLGAAGNGKKTCKAMKGLVAEGEEMLKEPGSGFVRDVGLIAAAQRVEHYEISGYGTAAALADQLNEPEAKKLLKETLDEEYTADSKLNKLAMGSWVRDGINEEAQQRV